MEDTSWDAQVEWLHIWLKYRKEWMDEAVYLPPGIE